MNIKKLFVVLILLVMTTCLLSGCNSAVSDEKAEPTVGTFVLITSKNVFRDVIQYIMYDPETMVMYSGLRDDDIGSGISLSPMYNPDGTLRLYTPKDE